MSEVITMSHGSHEIKLQVLEKPKNAPSPSDGFIIYLDSDRHVKGPFIPSTIQGAREVYQQRLEKSAVSDLAYGSFLSMLAMSEQEAVAEGLPTRKQFLECKGAAAPMHTAIFKAMAKAVWARYCKQLQEERLEREAKLAQQQQRRAQQQQQQQQQQQHRQQQEQQQQQGGEQQGQGRHEAGGQHQNVVRSELSPTTPRQEALKRQREQREKTQQQQQQQQLSQQEHAGEPPAKKAKQAQPANLSVLHDLEKQLRTASARIKKDLRTPLSKATTKEEQRDLQTFAAEELVKMSNSLHNKLKSAAAACSNAAAQEQSEDEEEGNDGA
ncbi:hypothetical protein DUNSADRAFT_7167 [Dunaliella salina]|uniref:Uncharacterized protein n=1 Tax=Dunaliella salina TaxID=3046 RepID=A0ABQ7GLY5_DUNSA|nr:hypothetical protein DUNSADRAFT_7167 [Dunaliella salina]|eukprot:KAF5835619.1 hypothetical protein DUNSADRAFT_7167 [Dunaliella salina]